VTGGFHVQCFTRSSSPGVSWRLLSGNNREAGRGAIGSADAELCRLEVIRLQSREPEMVGRIQRADLNRWTWQLMLDDVPVAMAGRSSDRLIRVESALATFRASLVDATINPTVVLTDSRRWRVAGR
jgi:hypothetical protein